jgi:hypothetical protein
LLWQNKVAENGNRRHLLSLLHAPKDENGQLRKWECAVTTSQTSGYSPVCTGRAAGMNRKRS